MKAKTKNTNKEKMRPIEWSNIYNITIMDIDGWRIDKKPFDEPIDEVDFYSRMTQSTCIFGKKAFAIMKKREKTLNLK